MISNFWRHCAISELKISKNHFATFDFFVKMKLVSTYCTYMHEFGFTDTYLCPDVEFDFGSFELPCLHSIISGRGLAGNRST